MEKAVIHFVSCIDDGLKLRRALAAYTNKINASAKPVKQSLVATVTLRNVPPFIASYDIPRGILYAIQATMGFLFMLAVMLVPPLCSHSDSLTRI